jgi:type III pantothenate kinase
MLLVADIGNTNIVLGLFKNSKLLHKIRIQSVLNKPSDDYAVDIIEAFLNSKIDSLSISNFVIASVVPPITKVIQESFKKISSKDSVNNIHILSQNGFEPHFKCNLANKFEIGQDRIVNAISAYKKFGDNLTIIDFGTATTFDIVGKDGEYLGGIISPGINLSLKTLHEMTAQLPKISISRQKNVIGKNTIEAMNSGVFHGYISLVKGLCKKIDAELGVETKKIYTGGLINIFREDLKIADEFYCPDLTIEGLQYIFEEKKGKNKWI